jgi:virginiamycin B lyase
MSSTRNLRASIVGITVIATLVAGCGDATSTAPMEPSPTAATTAPSADPSSAPPTSDPPTSAPSSPPPASEGDVTLVAREWDVPTGSHPHDVAPAPDGGVWYTGQFVGTLGHLDPGTGDVRQVRLGRGSAPHGVITGPDGNAWITDGGLNAIVRVDAESDEVTVFELPAAFPDANLNTAVFDGDGILWFTGQSGMYGRLDPASGEMDAWAAPQGRGPYGITATPDGQIWYASLAGSHIARVDPATGEATVVQPPTANQGARRVWTDSVGRIWVSEWDAGQVSVHDPASGAWEQWPLPGVRPQAYAVYVDERDIVWLTDFDANAIVRFDPSTEAFTSIELPTEDARVRQLLGRPGEIWGAESATDKLVRITEE